MLACRQILLMWCMVTLPCQGFSLCIDQWGITLRNKQVAHPKTVRSCSAYVLITPDKESTFGILKSRFKILSAKPYYPFPTQVDIVLACTVLHNYIDVTDPIHDEFSQEEIDVGDEPGDTMNEDGDSTITYSPAIPKREQIEARNEWKQKRNQNCMGDVGWLLWQV